MGEPDIFATISDTELLAEVTRRGLEAAVSQSAGAVALDAAQSETTPENPVVSVESLMATLDTALHTYNSFVDVVNTERASMPGHKKTKLLTAIDEAIIRADVESLVTNPDILAELQADADYFAKYPCADSPAVGFDVVIVPEELTTSDVAAMAVNVQSKVASGYSPYLRGPLFDDKRIPEVTGKGYRAVFAPRHYNVPNLSTSYQVTWMNRKNEDTKATELQTATDAEAVAQINNLALVGALDDPSSRYEATHFRRFDQGPVDGRVCHVSRVCVNEQGMLLLELSYFGYDLPTRALVVPKQNA